MDLWFSEKEPYADGTNLLASARHGAAAMAVVRWLHRVKQIALFLLFFLHQIGSLVRCLVHTA